MKNYVSINANDVKKMFKVCGACLDTNGARPRPFSATIKE